MDTDTILKRERILDWLNSEHIFKISKYHQNNVVSEPQSEEETPDPERGFFSRMSPS